MTLITNEAFVRVDTDPVETRYRRHRAEVVNLHGVAQEQPEPKYLPLERLASFRETEIWTAGARIGFICGGLVGLGAGCAGAIFWVDLGRRLVS